MITIKIGGSLLNNNKLIYLLELIVQSKKKCILIPGGGIFADAVRIEQKKLKFDNLVAHNLSILSMLKIGYILKSKIPQHCKIINNINEMFDQNKKNIGIWNPEKEISNEENQFTNWDTTSDTISLDISNRIGSQILIIFKSCEVPGDKKKITSFKLNTKKTEEFSKNNILDKRFPSVFLNAKFPVYVFSINQSVFLKELLLSF